jgi:hypothetical protein
LISGFTKCSHSLPYIERKFQMKATTTLYITEKSTEPNLEAYHKRQPPPILCCKRQGVSTPARAMWLVVIEDCIVTIDAMGCQSEIA